MKIQILKKLDWAVGALVTKVLPRPSSAGSVDCLGRILVIRPGGIGDAVHLVPALTAMQKAVPGLQIDILAEKRNAGVFDLYPAVREVFCYDFPGQLCRALCKKYDLVIDTEQWHRLSAVTARLTRAQRRIGFATNERSRLFGMTADYSHAEYEAESFLALARTATGLDLPQAIAPPFLKPDLSVISAAGKILAPLQGRPFVTLFPGASIPERKWGALRFRRLAEDLNGKGFPVVVVGGPGDGTEGEEILSRLNGLNLAGRTSLAETAAIIDRSALLVSGDSGVLHIAVGLGKPTVSLFGPGIQEKWAPFGENHIFINKNLPCSPCTRFGYTPQCKIDAKCMKDITVDEVFEAAMRLLPIELRRRSTEKLCLLSPNYLKDQLSRGGTRGQ